MGKTLQIEQQVALILKDVYAFKSREIATIMRSTEAAVKHTQAALMKIEMAKEADQSSKRALLALRVKLVRGVDPLNALGTDLHDVFMQISREVNANPDQEAV